jgi:hypothetical protein
MPTDIEHTISQRVFRAKQRELAQHAVQICGNIIAERANLVSFNHKLLSWRGRL